MDLVGSTSRTQRTNSTEEESRRRMDQRGAISGSASSRQLVSQTNICKWADSLTPRGWGGQFNTMVSNCPPPPSWCQIVRGVKLSPSTCWCQIVLLCMMVSNCPRCQIVLFAFLVSNCPTCHYGVKLSEVSNGPRCQIVRSVKWSQDHGSAETSFPRVDIFDSVK